MVIKLATTNLELNQALPLKMALVHYLIQTWRHVVPLIRDVQIFHYGQKAFKKYLQREAAAKFFDFNIRARPKLPCRKVLDSV